MREKRISKQLDDGRRRAWVKKKKKKSQIVSRYRKHHQHATDRALLFWTLHHWEHHRTKALPLGNDRDVFVQDAGQAVGVGLVKAQNAVDALELGAIVDGKPALQKSGLSG
jgi:hypothetical protein